MDAGNEVKGEINGVAGRIGCNAQKDDLLSFSKEKHCFLQVNPLWVFASVFNNYTRVNLHLSFNQLSSSKIL